MFFVVLGRCSVFRGEGMPPVRVCTEGDCFGELELFGVCKTRTAKVRCDTVCVLRVLSRKSLLDAVRRFPEASAQLQKLVEAHGYSRLAVQQELSKMELLQGFSAEFVQTLADRMYEQPFFFGQTLIEEGEEGHHMYVLVRGEVEVWKCDVKVMHIQAPAVVGELALLRSCCSRGTSAQLC